MICFVIQKSHTIGEKMMYQRSLFWITKELYLCMTNGHSIQPGNMTMYKCFSYDKKSKKYVTSELEK